MNFFNHVMDREAVAIITEEFRDITNNDMHIIEAIGVDEPKNMSGKNMIRAIIKDMSEEEMEKKF